MNESILIEKNNLQYNMKDLKERTRKFAPDCIKFIEKIPDSFIARYFKGQLLRSSSSIAANYRAANLGQTKAVFISKLSIVIEEADESEFWLEMFEAGKITSVPELEYLKKEARELASIFITSRKTAQKNN